MKRLKASPERWNPSTCLQATKRSLQPHLQTSPQTPRWLQLATTTRFHRKEVLRLPIATNLVRKTPHNLALHRTRSLPGWGWQSKTVLPWRHQAIKWRHLTGEREIRGKFMDRISVVTRRGPYGDWTLYLVCLIIFFILFCFY